MHISFTTSTNKLSHLSPKTYRILFFASAALFSFKHMIVDQSVRVIASNTLYIIKNVASPQVCLTLPRVESNVEIGTQRFLPFRFWLIIYSYSRFSQLKFRSLIAVQLLPQIQWDQDNSDSPRCWSYEVWRLTAFLICSGVSICWMADIIYSISKTGFTWSQQTLRMAIPSLEWSRTKTYLCLSSGML